RGDGCVWPAGVLGVSAADRPHAPGLPPQGDGYAGVPRAALSSGVSGVLRDVPVHALEERLLPVRGLRPEVRQSRARGRHPDARGNPDLLLRAEEVRLAGLLLALCAAQALAQDYER